MIEAVHGPIGRKYFTGSSLNGFGLLCQDEILQFVELPGNDVPGRAIAFHLLYRGIDTKKSVTICLSAQFITLRKRYNVLSEVWAF